MFDSRKMKKNMYENSLGLDPVKILKIFYVHLSSKPLRELNSGTFYVLVDAYVFINVYIYILSLYMYLLIYFVKTVVNQKKT